MGRQGLRQSGQVKEHLRDFVFVTPNSLTFCLIELTESPNCDGKNRVRFNLVSGLISDQIPDLNRYDN